jgi:hypothetical protein
MMNTLRDVQTAVYAALLHGKQAAESSVVPGSLGVERRIEIYRRNVLSNLRGALKAVYPVILKLVGEAFFNEAAHQYARTYPSHSGDLNQFGAQFAHFLGAYLPARDLPYLPDVAWLEWARHESFHAADAGTLDLTRLAAMPSESFAALRFRLAPAVRLVCSDYPVLAIWEVNQDSHQGDDLGAGGGAVLVMRRDYALGIESIGADEYLFLKGLAEGLTLEQISEVEGFAQSGDFLAALLQKYVLAGVIVDFD